MITLDQLKELAAAGKLHYQEFHFTGRHDCTRTIGPRGGVKESIVTVRVSGSLRTWKRDPTRFRLPVKYGMYESSEITNSNAHNWHLTADCPLRADGHDEFAAVG